ncbi:MAG: SPOR domain-containing protein [Candidatus Omnitrophica bacterium]|nr:SPOR domain-containing protein [Candidatus Omnitrophota bacterium]
MINFFKKYKIFKPSRQPLNLSENEIQERIYGKEKKPPVEDTRQDEKIKEKPAKVSKEDPGGQPELDFVPADQKKNIERLKGERDSFRRELGFLKKQYTSLSKQKTSLSAKLVQLETELAVIKREQGLPGAVQLKEKAARILAVCWERWGAKKTIYLGVGALILLIVIFSIGIMMASRGAISPQHYKELLSDDSRTAQSVKKPTVNVNVTPARTNSIDRKVTPYTIQICVYQKKRDAEKLLSRFKAKGYDADMVEVPSLKGKKHYRIYIGHFSNRSQALVTLKKIKSREGFRDSFVRRR